MAQQNSQNMSLNKTPALDGRITVMPAVYLPGMKKGLSAKTVFLILGGIIFVALIAVIAAFLIRRDQQQIVQQPPVQTETSNAIQPQQAEEDTEKQEETEEPEPVIEEETEPPVRQDLVEIPAPSLALPPSEDTDQDGLTDIEEQLFATSSGVPDTDGDSFLDGTELVNLYDPATAGALLEVSSLIKIARNDEKGFQMLIPVSWSASKQTPDGRLFTISPAQGDEQFSITTHDNPERMTVVQWYQQQVPGADLNNFLNFENEAGWNGIMSQDGSLIIATYGSEGAGARAFMFVMHYDPGNTASMRFPTVWQMMVNSVTVADTAQQTP